MAYCTGWPIPHIRDELDLPTLDALQRQWAQFPPLPVMVARYLGAAKPIKHITRLEEQNVIPTTRLPAAEWDALLKAHNLPG